jgi:predicted nuclease of predicted toxin-antitoxin system
LEAAPDIEVWNYARDNDLIIVSKDSDFHDRCLLYGAPPKVIWLRIGNCSTQQVIELLRSHVAEIAEFVNNEEESFFVLS